MILENSSTASVLLSTSEDLGWCCANEEVSKAYAQLFTYLIEGFQLNWAITMLQL